MLDVNHVNYNLNPITTKPKTNNHRKVEGSMRKVLFSALVMTFLAGMLFAAPFQTLGMLRTPDAYVLPHKAAEILLVGYYRDVAKPSYVDMDRWGNFVPYGMLGVGLFDRAEIGLFAGDGLYFMNTKVKLVEETLRMPQISIGMDNIFSGINEHRAQDPNPGWYWESHPDKTNYEYYSFYAVASKQVVIGKTNWMFNVGGGNNRFTGQVPRSRIFNGLFASIEFSPFKDFFLQGEYSGHDFQAGLKYTFGNFGVRVGAQAIEDLFKDNGYEENLRVALGISYLFDKYATAKRRPDIVELAKGARSAEEPFIEITDDGPEVVITDTPPDEPLGEVSLGTGTADIGVQGGSSYKELSPEVKDLLGELRSLREEREKAQKALLDLRAWLKENKQ